MATRLTQMFRIPLGAQVRELTDAVGLLFLGKGHCNKARFHDSPEFHAYSRPKRYGGHFGWSVRPGLRFWRAASSNHS